jgi:membrane-bound ClpP family serine protease
MSALRKLAAAVAVLSGAWAPAQAMDFRVDPSHPDFLMIYATGTIEADSATRFRLFLEALPPDLKRLEARGSAAVVLDSPGGLVMYAMVMAASIESHHFMTGVSGGIPASGSTTRLMGLRKKRTSSAKRTLIKRIPPW